MSERVREKIFDFAGRSAERMRAQLQSEQKAQVMPLERAEDARCLSKSINEFYEPKFANQFEPAQVARRSQ
jgi:hypothetical protein